jgi:hypothetical protein
MSIYKAFFGFYLSFNDLFFRGCFVASLGFLIWQLRRAFWFDRSFQGFFIPLGFEFSASRVLSLYDRPCPLINALPAQTC